MLIMDQGNPIYILELPLKHTKLGLLGPSFAKTIKEIRSQDENST
jgi:hypothetical protein